jgi:hypothetical protein
MELEQLSDKIKMIERTHPTLYKMWDTYINCKINDTNKIINKCNNMLDYAKEHNEPPLDVLLTLTILNIK